MDHAPASRETPIGIDAAFRAMMRRAREHDDVEEGFWNMVVDVTIGFVGHDEDEDEDEDEDVNMDVDVDVDLDDANDGRRMRMRTPPGRVSYVDPDAFRAFCTNNFGAAGAAGAADAAAAPDAAAENAALACARVLQFVDEEEDEERDV
jgi:hypothetical protein